jgi:hypothetical protein
MALELKERQKIGAEETATKKEDKMNDDILVHGSRISGFGRFDRSYAGSSR